MEVHFNFEAILKTSDWDGYFVDSMVQIYVGVYGIFILALIDRHGYDTGNLHI
jgi:hypothetical protein